ncbi:MAG: hypothetical protein V4709_09725 [Pseudomonadota bacterium]
MKTLILDRHAVAAEPEHWLNFVAAGQTRVVIQREGKPYVALVPYVRPSPNKQTAKRRSKA